MDINASLKLHVPGRKSGMMNGSNSRSVSHGRQSRAIFEGGCTALGGNAVRAKET